MGPCSRLLLLPLAGTPAGLSGLFQAFAGACLCVECNAPCSLGPNGVCERGVCTSSACVQLYKHHISSPLLLSLSLSLSLSVLSLSLTLSLILSLCLSSLYLFRFLSSHFFSLPFCLHSLISLFLSLSLSLSLSFHLPLSMSLFHIHLSFSL